MDFWKKPLRRIGESHVSHRDKVLWDVSDGGSGPVVRNGIFLIAKPCFWAKLVAMLSFVVFAKENAMTTQLPPSSDQAISSEMTSNKVKLLLADDTSTTTIPSPPSPPATPHHDVHADKTMPSDPPVHIDTHGDSN